MYRQVTDGFEVSVEPFYVEEQSAPDDNYYFFAYRVNVRNLGNKPVKLIGRHWIVTDGFGNVEKIHGEGVVGEKPLIEPGASFEYTSACPLPTPTGNMRGAYEIQEINGGRRRISIPLFFLRHPSTFH